MVFKSRNIVRHKKSEEMPFKPARMNKEAFSKSDVRFTHVQMLIGAKNHKLILNEGREGELSAF